MFESHPNQLKKSVFVNKIVKLDWDSDFFSLEVGELELSSNDRTFEPQAAFDVLYVKQNQEHDLTIPNFKETFSEIKVVFSKLINADKKLIYNQEIKSFQETTLDKESIYELAYESGKYSRFKLDPNFDSHKFKILYKTWVDNSLNKKYADDVLVFILDAKIVGFVTYKINTDFAVIGLIAVNSNFQGKGIGSKLLNAVESHLIKNNIPELRVPTQFQNTTACQFYTKMGFSIKSQLIIKHYWKIKS